ncbi:PAS domain S-box protein [Fischerella thermalis]|uniref:PAS domain S-box protein n=1 Tax=Fischerella thermalis TaxID=372787 RepID=UPI00307D3A6D
MAQNRWLLILLSLLTLFLAHGMALFYRVQPAVSLWFPPSGVAIAITLWLGPIGAVLTGIISVTMASFWGSDGWTYLVGLTDITEPLVAWFLYRRCFQGSLTLHGLRNATKFILIAPLAACATSAIIGSSVLVALGKMPEQSLSETIVRWWLGNAIGTMAIAPSALLLLTPLLKRWGWIPVSDQTEQPEYITSPCLYTRWLEIAAIVLATVCTAWFTVQATQDTNFTFEQFSLLGFIPIVWAATRFGATGGMLTASFYVLVTLFDYLLLYPHAISLPQFPVATEILHVHKLSLLIQCFVGLVVGTAITEREKSLVDLEVERVRLSEYQTRAQLSEKLFQLNRLLTEVNQQLQESEERFRASVENMLDCFGVYCAIRDDSGQIVDFRIEYVNDAACVNNRMTREEQIGRGLCEILPRHRETGLFDEYCQVVETGQPLVKDALIYDDIYNQRRLVRAFDIRIAKFGDGFIATWRDVTARCQAEEELRCRQQEFEALVENSPDVISRLDRELRHVYVNPAMEKASGLPPQAVIGKTPSELGMSEELSQQWQTNLQTVLSTGQPQIDEFCLPAPDGTTHFYQARIVPEMTVDGFVTSVLVVTRDITELKLTEAALRKSEDLSRTILENFPNGDVFLFDQDLRYILAEGTGLAMVGITKADLEGKTIWEAFPPETCHVIEPAYRNALIGITSRLEACYADHIYDVQVIPLRSSSGEIIVGMAITQDITQRKQMEIALQENERRLSLALKAAKAGIWEWDIATNKTFWSDENFRLIGYEPGTCETNYDNWLRAVHPEDRELIDLHVKTVVEEKTDLNLEYRVLLPDGTVRWLNDIGEIIFDAQGEPKGMSGLQLDITDRKLTEMALRESEERLRLALSAANQGLYDLNIQTGDAVVSPEYARMLGYEPDEFQETNQAWRSRLHPDDKQTVYRVYEEYIAGKRNEYRVEFRQRTKSGDWKWILSIGKIVAWTEDGKPLRMLGTHTDITERKQVELARQKSETILNAFITSSPIGLALLDREFRYFYANEALANINGVPLSTHLGRTLGEILPQIAPQLQPMLRQIMQTQEPVLNLELSGEIIPGISRHCLTNYFPVCLPNGEVLGVGITVMDITELKLAEAALRQSELMFRTLADTMPQMFWITRPDGYHEYFNQRWYDYTGTTLEQTQGEGWQNILHPEDVERTIAVWQYCLRTGESYNIEYRFRRACDGQYRWHLGRAFPLRDQDGHIVKWFGSCTDIHDQKLAIEERAQALERERAARIELERASRMKDEFLAVVSHELRSPLNGILGWSRLLRTRKLSPDKTEQALASIERNAQAQTQLIEDLLDISRIIRGKVRLNLRPTNLIPVIQAALDTVSPTASTKSINLQFTILDFGLEDADGNSAMESSDIQNPNFQVSGDPDRLQQVIWNLLSNAVKFTPEGGQVEVRLSKGMVSGNCRQGGNLSPLSHPSLIYAQIQVIDTGKGISPEFLPYVFDRFRQADATTTRTQGGLGLGLAIVRNLVELHGGTISVASQGEGQGSTFTIQLPLLSTGPVPNELAELAILRQTNCETNFNLSGLKILTVDDEADTREFLQTALEQYGAIVTTAASTREALQLVQQVKPDVLLSDIGMPGEDGYTLIRQLRSLPPEQGGQIPAAALTAYARQEDRQLALAAGFQMHVPKPIEPIQLLTVVARLAGRCN